MRVLFIASADYKYGASKSMMSLMIYMKEHYNVEPILLTKKRNKLNEICDENGIENYSCWYGDFMSGSPYSFLPLKVAKHITKYALYLYSILRKSSIMKCGIDFDTIDIVHTSHNRLQIGAYISKRMNIPHVWHIREFGKEDYNVVFYRPNTINYMNNNAEMFIAISNAVRECWVQRGIDENKITTVYNGLESKGFVPKKERNDNKLKIVMTGHVQPNKGQLQLVKAVALLPDEIRNNVQVDIIGEGYKDYISKINTVITKSALTNVSFLGYCNNVPEKLSEYDVGVVCSKAEGFGRVTVEYMLAGLYVIASDTGANPELVQDAEDGVLYKYNDEVDLSKKIQEIYLNHIRQGSKNFTNIFAMEKYAAGVYEIYKKVLQD